MMIRLKTKWFIFAILIVIFVDTSFAQAVRKPTRRPPNTKQNNLPKSAYATDTTQKPVNNNNKNQQSAYSNIGNAAKASIDTTLPIQVIPSKGNGLLDTSVRISLRNDAGVDQNLVKNKTPLPYEPIREDDAVFRVRVWRIIDTREKMNLPFRYAADEDNGNQRFISILLRAINNGDVTAFSGDNDRFTTPITPQAAMDAFSSGGKDTVPKYNQDGDIIGYEVRSKEINPDSVYKFEVKEEWIFDKETSRLFVRILGIAPVMPYTLSTGAVMVGTDRPLWWVYYPDARPVLSNYEVYNPKNYSARMSWEDLFESRMFSSYIVQSTVDNPFNLPLSDVYPNNTLFRLLEGERIKDKIFNYEQSLWSY
jgi:gliding motility associated protien GldN